MNEYLFFHAVECFALPMRVVYQIGPKQISFFLSLKLSNCKAMEKSTDLKSAHDEMHICRCCAVAGMLHSLSPTIFRGFSFFFCAKEEGGFEGRQSRLRTHRQKKRGRGKENCRRLALAAATAAAAAAAVCKRSTNVSIQQNCDCGRDGRTGEEEEEGAAAVSFPNSAFPARIPPFPLFLLLRPPPFLRSPPPRSFKPLKRRRRETLSAKRQCTYTV